MILKRPMLAATCDDITKLRYPVLATPKIDGIRCLCLDGKTPVSRSLKMIPNRYIQRYFAEYGIQGTDGELIVRAPKQMDMFSSAATFQTTTSGVMSEMGEPDFEYVVFDIIDSTPYHRRMDYLNCLFARFQERPRFIRLLPGVIRNPEELLAFEIKCLEQGYEGVIARTPDSPYKQGRSTLKEQWMVKIKRFRDAEAMIIGFEELMHNANAPERNALGYQERSTHQENMVGKGTLGALVVDCCPEFLGQTFKVGTGFNDAQRKDYWHRRDSLVGRRIKFKYQPHGVKDKPRIPVFLGFRED